MCRSNLLRCRGPASLWLETGYLPRLPNRAYLLHSSHRKVPVCPIKNMDTSCIAAYACNCDALPVML